MGQQQLLLLVLATIIVGLATTAGINAFQENRKRASQNALIQKATEMGSDLYSLMRKPTRYGGIDYRADGPNLIDSSDLFDRLEYDTIDSGTAKNWTTPVEGAGKEGICRIYTEDLPDGTALDSKDRFGVWCSSDASENNVVAIVDPTTRPPVQVRL